MSRKVCSVVDCGKFAAAKGYCMQHRRELIGKFPSDSKEAKAKSNKKIRKERGEGTFKAGQNLRSLEYNTSIKQEVLSHYSPEGILKCSNEECSVTDLDMLSLDHVNNDGAKDRGTGRGYAGVPLYGVLKREGFPSGFATLCHNHQMKKDIGNRRYLALYRLFMYYAVSMMHLTNSGGSVCPA